jgi:hypothetical protein
MRSSSAREPRLDPVRWRRPGRSALFRWAIVAALMATAAVMMWRGPGTCEPSCPPAAGRSSPGSSQVTPAVRDPTHPPPVSAGSTGGSGSVSGAESLGGPGSAGRSVVPPGLVGVPIRPAEPTALKLLHPGDRVDVFSVPEPGKSPQAIATAALVLGLTGADDPTTGGLLLAVTPAEARRTVTTPPGGYAVLLRPG